MLSGKEEMLAALREARMMREREKADRAEWIRRLAREGLTPREIQRRLHVHTYTVAKALAEAGIAPTLRPGAREEW